MDLKDLQKIAYLRTLGEKKGVRLLPLLFQTFISISGHFLWGFFKGVIFQFPFHQVHYDRSGNVDGGECTHGDPHKQGKGKTSQYFPTEEQ